MSTRLDDRATHGLGVAVPMVYAGGAVVLGLILPRLEHTFLPHLTSEINRDAAIAILSAIATGMMPLTGLVFSLAFVMVQFSATAYSPRLVAWLAGSWLMAHSLGVFTATFLYALAALAWIDRGGTEKVPLLTIWVALILMGVGIVFFVLLVGRLATLQISQVLNFVGNQGRSVIATFYARQQKDDGPEAPPSRNALPPVTQTLQFEGGPAVIQAVDLGRLVELASRRQAVVEVTAVVGDTLVDGMDVLRLRGAKEPVPVNDLRRCIRFGTDRTFEQDPKYAIRLLVDIAIRALSPAVNDPTTAVQALDQLEDLLIRLGRCKLSAGVVRGGDGAVRVVFAVPSWEDFLILALDEIRFYGANSVQVMRRMRALLLHLAANVPAGRREPLEAHLARVDNGIARTFADSEDRRDALVEDRQGLGLARER
jgi:uncharacterized membrane protein